MTVLRKRRWQPYASKANGTPEISVETAQDRVIIARREESAEIVASTLDAALGARELEAFLDSLSQVVRARGGFTVAARKTGLNRTSLYAILSSSANPTCVFRSTKTSKKG